VVTPPYIVEGILKSSAKIQKLCPFILAIRYIPFWVALFCFQTNTLSLTSTLTPSIDSGNVGCDEISIFPVVATKEGRLVVDEPSWPLFILVVISICFFYNYFIFKFILSSNWGSFELVINNHLMN
jgi:hypothetical protein